MEKNVRKVTFLILGLLALVLVVSFSGKIFEDVDAGEIVVIQDPDGDLHTYTQPGWVMQNFGTATHYRKSSQFWFSKHKEQGTEEDQSIKVRFNDGGHAQISGSIRYDMPTDEKAIVRIHSIFGSQESIEKQLIRTVIEKAIYMTGPLMSSKESYSEKRNDLISFVEDQANFGVYKTKTIDVKIKDAITDQEKTASVVQIVEKNGKIERQEESPIKTYGVKLSNLSINGVDYDGNVEKQIAQQQQAQMSVQTAIANAKKAEQDAITTEQQGKAAAAKAKWDQEVLKAKAVTQAEQEKEVAELAVKTAMAEKQRLILEGEGEAAKKRLAMQANNMLEYRIDAWKEVNIAYAKAMENSNWVPTTVVGGGNGNYANGAGAQGLIDMMMIKTAKELNLDMKTK